MIEGGQTAQSIKPVLKAVALLSAGLVLSGCLSSGPGSSALNLQSEPSSQVGAAALAALSPGIIPATAFSNLSRSGKDSALRAEFKALEETLPNVAVQWEDGSETVGEVRASTPYRVGSTTCRPYSHSGTVSGQSFSAKGTACRSDSGVWEPIS